MLNEELTFDGYSFVLNGCVFTTIDHLTIPKRENQIEELAGRNGGVLVESRLGVKTISLEGYFIGDDSNAAQNMYDTLAGVLNRSARLLIIPHGGSLRRYTATPENIILQQPDGLNRLVFSFSFVVPEGAAVADTTTTLISTTVTSSLASIDFTIAGSGVTRPLITLTYNSLTGGTAKTASVRNASDLIGVDFARTFVAGDVIIIDCNNYQIFINGVLTEPSGRFPSWQAGSGTLYYSDTLTTRSVTITATYRQRNI